MPRLAAKNGVVVREVTEQALANDRVLFSAASESTRLFRGYYFLQYFLASKRAMVYITVEGYGKASSAIDSFDKIIATQQWIE